jgi:hypothetical protein
MTSAMLADMDDAVHVEPYPAFHDVSTLRESRGWGYEIDQIFWGAWRYMRDRDAAMLGYCDLGGEG